MTINDMPAVLVEMNGQGFDILWIGDSGDLYFFLFPNDDDALVQQMIAVAQSLCVFHRKGEQVNPASDLRTRRMAARSPSPTTSAQANMC